MHPYRDSLSGEAGIREAQHIVTTVLVWSDELTPNQWRRLVDRHRKLCGELQIWVWSQLTAGGIKELELVKLVHAHFVDNVYLVFGVPTREERQAA